MTHLPCDKCGAELKVDGSTQTIVCVYCGTPTLVPESIWLRFHPPPPQAPVRLVVSPPSKRPAATLAIVIASVAVAGGVVPAIIAIVAASRATASFPSPAIPGPNKPSAPAVAAAGEACSGRTYACSADKKSELHCGPDDKMVIADTCKGPGGCRVSPDGNRVTCDTTFADPKDPCDIKDSACSTDHKAELRCEGGRFTVLATCKGPDGCTVTPARGGDGYTLSCDDHVADVGDPCFGSDRVACSSDKKAFLACTAQRFAVERTCRRGCVVKKIAGTDKVSMDCD